MKISRLTLAGFILVAVGGGLMLANASQARKMQSTIIAKDVDGFATKTEIESLQNFSAAHMGASTKFELSGSYQRALEAAQAAAMPEVSGQVYGDAQKACRKPNPVDQARCISSYVAAHSNPHSTVQEPVLPHKSDYIYTFGSPVWTPDAAGIALLVGVCCLLLSGWFRLVRHW